MPANSNPQKVGLDDRPPPPDFYLPEHLRTAVEEIRDHWTLMGGALWSELQELGLPEDQAGTVATDILVRLGCMIAMDLAVRLDHRAPRRERWLEVTGKTFDQVLALQLGLQGGDHD